MKKMLFRLIIRGNSLSFLCAQQRDFVFLYFWLHQNILSYLLNLFMILKGEFYQLQM